MLNTDKAWERWGRQNPYFGVLADQKFDPCNIDRHRDEFFATGRHSVADILERCERHFGAIERDCALDHGCGVGRLTLPLAERFGQVVALDVSVAMLAEGKANAAVAGTDNIEWHLADEELSNAPGDFDFVNSHLVLQHVPVRRGLRIAKHLIDKVKPGGGFHIDVSMRTDGGAARLLYWSSANVPGVKILQNIHAGRAWNAPAMQMNDYPLHRIIAYLAASGISEFVVLTRPEARFVTCSLIGRRPQA